MTVRSRSDFHDLYIDCARGYAVLMVIASHLTYAFVNLPWPAKRLASSGWFGVQLFFLASALTLLMSWHRELAHTGKVSLSAFFIRRFFRIAPVYYAAGLLYYWLDPPKGGFGPWHALETVAFVNAWNPSWTPTVQGAWAVVPGGWSISVEFAFYLMFPVFAAFATSLRRSLQVAVICLALGLAANLAAYALIHASYDRTAVSNFLFFWFPNQAIVFALGGVVFFLMRSEIVARLDVARRSTALAALSIGMFCLLPYLPLGHYLGDRPIVPAGLAACIPLMVFLIALSGGSPIFVNKIAGAVGRVSFSAYLLHFAILHLFAVFPGFFHTKTAGFAAIVAYGRGWLIAATMIYVASYVSYRLIEKPMVAFGKSLISRSHFPVGTA